MKKITNIIVLISFIIVAIIMIIEMIQGKFIFTQKNIITFFVIIVVIIITSLDYYLTKKK
jgi:hypothetical protein